MKRAAVARMLTVVFSRITEAEGRVLKGKKAWV